MGILSYLVVADGLSGAKLAESLNPAERWPAFVSKGIDTVKLATLYCAISGKTYHNDIQRSFKFVGGNQARSGSLEASSRIGR